MTKIHLILILLFFTCNLISQIPDSTVLKEAEHPNFQKQLDNYIDSDSMKMKVEKLNVLRRKYILLISHYNIAANLKDSIKMNDIKIAKKSNEDSCFIIMGLTKDSLNSFRTIFEKIEVTVRQYKERSITDLRNARDNFMQAIMPNIFVYYWLFYERAYMIKQKLDDLQL